MSNFDFVQAEWPDVHADCVRAEGYLRSRPAVGVLLRRRAVEQLVGTLYDVDGAAGAVPGRPGGADQRAGVQAPRSASGSGRS